MSELLHCSFCRKSQRDVKTLITGPDVHICNECVDVCVETLADAPVTRRPVRVTSPSSMPDAVRCSLCNFPTPAEDLLLLGPRGALCPGCVGAVERAVGEAGGGE